MAEIGSFTSRAHAAMAAGMLDAHGIPLRLAEGALMAVVLVGIVLAQVV